MAVMPEGKSRQQNGDGRSAPFLFKHDNPKNAADARFVIGIDAKRIGMRDFAAPCFQTGTLQRKLIECGSVPTFACEQSKRATAQSRCDQEA
jgi:hypothetical protein